MEVEKIGNDLLRKRISITMISANKCRKNFRVRNSLFVTPDMRYAGKNQWLKPYGKNLWRTGYSQSLRFLLNYTWKICLYNRDQWSPHKPLIVLGPDAVCLLMRCRRSYTSSSMWWPCQKYFIWIKTWEHIQMNPECETLMNDWPWLCKGSNAIKSTGQ